MAAMGMDPRLSAYFFLTTVAAESESFSVWGLVFRV